MKSRVRAAIGMVILVCGIRNAFASPCETQYRRFQSILAESHLPERFHRRIVAKAAAGWSAFRIGAGATTLASRDFSDASAVLAGNPPTQSIPVDAQKNVRDALDALTACVHSSDTPLTSVTIRVSSKNPSVTTTERRSDATIRVDDVEVATTGADGTAAVALVAGPHTITAEHLPNWRGTVNTNIAGTSSVQDVNIVMEAGADLAKPAVLEILEAPDGVLQRDFGTVTLQFLNSEDKRIPVSRVDSIELMSEGDVLNVTSMFAVKTDGTMKVSALQAFRAAVIARFDPMQIAVHAFDHEGLPYRSTAAFAVGRYHARVRITPPAAGTPALGSVFVRLTSTRNDYSFWSSTDGDGNAVFPLLPDGHYLVACDVEQRGVRYFGRGGFELNGENQIHDVTLFTVRPADASPARPPRSRALAAGAAAEQPEPVGAEGDTSVPTVTSDESRVLWAMLMLTPDRGLVVDKTLSYDDPRGLPQSSEADLKAALERDTNTAPSADHTVAIRVYDSDRRVVYRHATNMVFGKDVGSTRIPAPTPYTVVIIPARSDGTIELDSVDPRLRGSFDIQSAFAAVLPPAAQPRQQ